MGIGPKLLDILLDLRTSGKIEKRSKVIEIGAQQLANAFLTASEKLSQVRYEFDIGSDIILQEPLATQLAHGKLEQLNPMAPFSRDFWLWLGWEYSAIDIDGSPGSIPLDLNTDSIPENAIGKFHLVTNFGTTEHVANQMNAMKVIHELTALNGYMIHELPAQGYFNHGLVNYNYKFFWMLARSNGYRIEYADYVDSNENYDLPQNIIDFVGTYNPRPHHSITRARSSDGAILVVMQKVFDIDYVPPLDVPTGAKTEFEILRKRYWTVFEDDAFAKISQ